MTKSGLIEALAARMKHLPQKDLEVVVNTIFEAMTDALCRDERVEIRGFGSFSVRKRHARQGRNPKTGHAVDVPAKRVPFFTVGNELRERVNLGRTGSAEQALPATGTEPTHRSEPESQPNLSW